MSKFVGKFRKNQDYKDDYVGAKGKKKQVKSGHSEIKKLKTRYYDESGKNWNEEEYTAKV